MTLRLLIVLVAVTGCSRQHSMEWSGFSASGQSPLFSPGSALYRQIRFPATDMTAPMISVRLPDGTLLRHDQLTVEELDARGAEDRYAADVYATGRQPSGIAREFRYETGLFTTSFDQDGRLVGFSVLTYLRRRSRIPGVRWRSRTGEYYDTFTTHEARTASPREVLAVGDLYGMKMVLLPATRAELVEVFGEPVSETSYIPMPFLGP